jgi:prophage DNA circulation protein
MNGADRASSDTITRTRTQEDTVAAIEITDDALAIATDKAHAAGLSLTDWLTHAVAETAAHQEPVTELLVDDGGFPSPRGHD